MLGKGIDVQARSRILVVLVLLVASLALGLVACGGDDSGADAASTSTAAQAPNEVYAEALRDAATATAGLAGVIASGDDPEDAAASIRDRLADWQDAISAADAAELTEMTLVEQRDALVAASPAYVEAWTAVADEWETGTANGILELVQQRSPISDGTSALATAVQGALENAGAAAADELRGVQQEIESALDEVRQAG